MPSQYRSFAVTVVPGSTPAAPVVTDVSFPPFYVSEITAHIPPGPLGQLGFQIASSSQQVIPWNDGQWIVPNDDRLTWPISNAPSSGDWQVIAYNTGVFDHTIYLQFALDPVGVAPAAPATLPSLAALSSPVPVTDGSGAPIDQSIADLIASTVGGAG